MSTNIRLLIERKLAILQFKVKGEILTQWSVNIIIHRATKLRVIISIRFLDTIKDHVETKKYKNHELIMQEVLKEKSMFSNKANLHPEEELSVITIKLQYINPSRCLINLSNQLIERSENSKEPSKET